MAGSGVAITTPHTSSPRTASGTSSIWTMPYWQKECWVVVNLSAGGGAGDSMRIVLECDAGIGSNWIDVATTSRWESTQDGTEANANLTGELNIFEASGAATGWFLAYYAALPPGPLVANGNRYRLHHYLTDSGDGVSYTFQSRVWWRT